MKEEFLFLFSNLVIFVQNSTKGQSKRVWMMDTESWVENANVAHQLSAQAVPKQ